MSIANVMTDQRVLSRTWMCHKDDREVVLLAEASLREQILQNSFFRTGVKATEDIIEEKKSLSGVKSPS